MFIKQVIGDDYMPFTLPGSGRNKKLTGTFTDILMADMNNDGLLGLSIPKFNITWSKELLIGLEYGL